MPRQRRKNRGRMSCVCTCERTEEGGIGEGGSDFDGQVEGMKEAEKWRKKDGRPSFARM